MPGPRSLLGRAMYGGVEGGSIPGEYQRVGWVYQRAGGALERVGGRCTRDGVPEGQVYQRVGQVYQRGVRYTTRTPGHGT